MQVTVVGEPSVQGLLRTRVTTDISSALQAVVTTGSRFVVNDSVWYFRKRRGGVAPCVVNSASYMSSRFQFALSTHSDWQGETEVENQRIDGFGRLAITGTAYTLARPSLFRFLEEYTEHYLPADADIGALATLISEMYLKRKLFDVSSIPTQLHHYFTSESINSHMRIGVEFETGNIASSFRALMKLGYLFASGKIDAGVFVTSIDKPNCAARIWPVSNRNGSFQELRQRRYKDNIAVPLWEFGFAPDGFDREAPYLGANGELFRPQPITEITDASGTVTIEGVEYSRWLGENGEELLRPTAPMPFAAGLSAD